VAHEATHKPLVKKYPVWQAVQVETLPLHEVHPEAQDWQFPFTFIVPVGQELTHSPALATPEAQLVQLLELTAHEEHFELHFKQLFVEASVK
jgi:hypothetical protein